MSDKKVCEICPKHCRLEVGEVGRCRARINDGEKITALNYGAVTSLALDPIENFFQAVKFFLSAVTVAT